MRTIVDVEGREQRNVGHSHTGDVYALPAVRGTAPRAPAGKRGTKSHHAKDSQGVVGGPAEGDERSHRETDDAECPEVDASRTRVAPRGLGAEHRDKPGDNRRNSCSHVD